MKLIVNKKIPMRFLLTRRKTLIYALLLAALGCKSKKDDPAPPPELSEQEKVTALLTGGTATWTPPISNGVSLAGIDVTEELFEGFSIRFTQNQLFTTGTTPVWLRTDTWQFKTGSSTIIIRGQDAKEVTIENISETELRISLDWDQTTFEGGRSTSLPGRYSFTLLK